MKLIDIQKRFYDSSLKRDSDLFSLDEFKSWFNSKQQSSDYFVEQIDWDSCEKWKFDKQTGFLSHESGKFFSIIGLDVKTNFGFIPHWEQVIINQAEIGILGLIVKEFNGVLHFLVQAKMEPGNPGLVQISPTLQATKSNFTQVHKGRKPKFLEFFLNSQHSKVIIDQLQIEQSGRFLKKRNRNMIVEVQADLEIDDNFKWLSLGQIKELLNYDNVINMDTRTVISCISYFELFNDKACSEELKAHNTASDKVKKYITSLSDSNFSLHNEYDIISWITELKSYYELSYQIKPLDQLSQWELTKDSIQHITQDLFKVFPYSIRTGDREVNAWCQPLIKDTNVGLVGFLTTEINGVLHFLVQGKVEPGSLDVVDFSPTVSVSDYKRFEGNTEKAPIFISDFLNNESSEVFNDTIQSEEGGRFFQVQNRYMIVYNKNARDYDLPKNFIWMSLGQIQLFIKHSYFNIEGRSLISCIELI